MKRKVFAAVLTVALAATAFVGCAQKPAAAPAAKKADAVTTASIVDNNAAFEKAIGPDGKYITAILKDLTFDKELVVDGDKKNGKKDDKGNELFQRKIALYSQDDKKNVTARFTLTAPKITFNSANGSLEHGTFKGDVYVAGKNFKLVDNKVEGNIYFLNEDAEKTFTKDDKSVVTGKIEGCY